MGTMKLSVLALCFAAVSAEADPQLLYTVGAVAHVPTVKVVETPAEVKTSVVPYALTHPLLHGYGYAGLGYGYPYYSLTHSLYLCSPTYLCCSCGSTDLCYPWPSWIPWPPRIPWSSLPPACCPCS